MSNTMSKYCEKNLGAGISDPAEDSRVGTSGPEDSSCAGTSDPEDNRRASTSGAEDSSCAGTRGPENSSGTGTCSPEDSSSAGTSDPEDNSRAGTNVPEESSCVGTRGPEESSGTGTSGPEDSSGAGTSDPEDSSGAGTSDPEDNSVAGTSGNENRSGAGTTEHGDSNAASTSRLEDNCSAGISIPEDSSGAGTSDCEENCNAGTSSPGKNSDAGTSGAEKNSGACTSCPEENSDAGTSDPEDNNVSDTSGSVNSSGAATSGSVTDPMPPMSDTENWFIEKRVDDIVNKYKYNVSKRGKWILVFPIDKMNEMWAKVCKLYTEGKLEGIQFVRTSTANDVRPQGGSIRFYCGPYDDEELVKSYGQSVVRFMKYSRQNRVINFKTDEQTKKQTKSVFLYRLQVSRTERGCQDDCNDEQQPRSITDKQYIAEIITDIEDRYKYDWTLRGRWTMWCWPDTLDKAWQGACTLYRQEKLTGVRSIGVMTGKSRPSEPKPIFFHCGPCSDRRLMMEYGRGIASQLGHYSSGTLLGYKVSCDSETRARLSQQLGEDKYLYRLGARLNSASTPSGSSHQLTSSSSGANAAHSDSGPQLVGLPSTVDSGDKAKSDNNLAGRVPAARLNHEDFREKSLEIPRRKERFSIRTHEYEEQEL